MGVSRASANTLAASLHGYTEAAKGQWGNPGRESCVEAGG
jgi:hypothetical protein